MIDHIVFTLAFAPPLLLVRMLLSDVFRIHALLCFLSFSLELLRLQPFIISREQLPQFSVSSVSFVVLPYFLVITFLVCSITDSKNPRSFFRLRGKEAPSLLN